MENLSGTQSHYLLLAIASSRFEGYLGKEPNKSVLCPCHCMRKRVLRWKVPASTFAALLGNALPRTWSLTSEPRQACMGLPLMVTVSYWLLRELGSLFHPKLYQLPITCVLKREMQDCHWNHLLSLLCISLVFFAISWTVFFPQVCCTDRLYREGHCPFFSYRAFLLYK